jgi:hypothetical protein
MEIAEIEKFIVAEDKGLAAVHAMCTVRFVNQVLSGERSSDTETAKKVLEKLELLAEINKKWMKEKELIAA